MSGRGCSSRATSTGSPLRCGIGTGTSWPSKRPPSIAATARRWLSAAKASWRSRVTCQSSATHSAVSPSEIAGWAASSFGLTKRQPSVLSTSSRVPRSKAASGFSMTKGARDIDSTPPATKTSPSPTAIA